MTSFFGSCTSLFFSLNGCSSPGFFAALVDTAYCSPAAEVWWGTVTIWAGAAYTTLSDWILLLSVVPSVPPSDALLLTVPVGLYKYVHVTCVLP